MKKIIFINIGILLFIINSIYAQRNDTIVYYFPKEYFLDTINHFEQEKNEEFFERRKSTAFLFVNTPYSLHLKELNEPVLFKEYTNETYRFTWIGYFSFLNPVSIRVEINNDNIFLISKYIGRNKKNKKLFVNDTIFLDDQEMIIFKNKLDSINFWDIPTIEQTNIAVMDGSTWILEGKKAEKYHAVARHVDWEKDIGGFCLYLVKLSKIKFNRRHQLSN